MKQKMARIENFKERFRAEREKSIEQHAKKEKTREKKFDELTKKQNKEFKAKMQKFSEKRSTVAMNNKNNEKIME